MGISIKQIQPTDTPAWDAYVHAHPQATLYHLSGWKNVIEKTYHHKTYYLIALQKESSLCQRRIDVSQFHLETEKKSVKSCLPCGMRSLFLRGKSCLTTNSIVGILPLVHLKHFLFGNSLISIPFFDLGGILADDVEAQKALLLETMKLGRDLKVENIELRHTQPLSCLNSNHIFQSSLKNEQSSQTNPNDLLKPGEPVELSCFFRQRGTEVSQFHQEIEKKEKSSQSRKSCQKTYTSTKSHKVRMLLNLTDSSEKLMKSFKSKLRSQIRKPLKEGLTSKVGGLELLDDFYNVFSINMRDLGSPVHPKKLMQNVLDEFPDFAKLIIVYRHTQPVACSLIVGFKDTLENPWASSLREYSRFSPNMFLYWTMLEYACNNGFKYFDFGRSSPDEGTYKFKEQWGATPNPLHWHYISVNGKPLDKETSEKSKFNKAIQYWQKLPVPITKIIGPIIRKHIGL